MTDDAWEAEYATFLRSLAEHQGRALAGDEHARRVCNEYSLGRWAGDHPMKALRIAESLAR
jgi:hypothetical protein